MQWWQVIAILEETFETIASFMLTMRDQGGIS